MIWFELKTCTFCYLFDNCTRWVFIIKHNIGTVWILLNQTNFCGYRQCTKRVRISFQWLDRNISMKINCKEKLKDLYRKHSTYVLYSLFLETCADNLAYFIAFIASNKPFWNFTEYCEYWNFLNYIYMPKYISFCSACSKIDHIF